jgi:hypothetical protein
MATPVDGPERAEELVRALADDVAALRRRIALLIIPA